MKKLSLLSIFVLLISAFAFSASALGPTWVGVISDQNVAQGSGSAIYDSDLTAAPGGDADDPENGALTFSIQSENTAQVDCTITGNQLSGVPASGFTGTAICTVRVVDDEGLFADDTFNIAVSSPIKITGSSVLENTLVIATPKDYNDEIKLNLINIGATTLNFPVQAIPNIVLQDKNGNTVNDITISISNLPSTLASGPTPHILTLTFDIDRKVDVGSYEGKLTITAQEGSKELNVRIDVSPEDICPDGRRGDGEFVANNDAGTLRIKNFVFNPDDKFGPGEIIDVRDVEVENEWDDDINDVIVEAILYNVDQDEVIARAESDPEDVDEGDNVDFNDFELEVPSSSRDLDESDQYILYLHAFEDGSEDEHCTYDYIDDIKFKREADDVDIISASVTPSTVMCNADANFIVTVQNVGEDEQDIVTVRLLDSPLGLDFESDQFSLDQFDDRDDTATLTHTYRIPSTTSAGDYSVEAIVVFDKGKETDSTFIPVKVTCGKTSGTAGGSVSISLIQDTVTASQGKLFGLPFKLT